MDTLRESAAALVDPTSITATSVALALFAFFNSIRILAYLPQILTIARDKAGATAISYTTWSLFAASHLSTVVYAVVLHADWHVAILFMGNCLGCFAIIAVTAHKRRCYHRRSPSRNDPVVDLVLRARAPSLHTSAGFSGPHRQPAVHTRSAIRETAG